MDIMIIMMEKYIDYLEDIVVEWIVEFVVEKVKIDEFLYRMFLK